jgi:hypothetical protein
MKLPDLSSLNTNGVSKSLLESPLASILLICSVVNGSKSDAYWKGLSSCSAAKGLEASELRSA